MAVYCTCVYTAGYASLIAPAYEVFRLSWDVAAVSFLVTLGLGRKAPLPLTLTHNPSSLSPKLSS